MHCPEKTLILFHTLSTHAKLRVLPLPDGSRTLRFRREEGLLGFAVTCGGDQGEAVTSVAPSAGLVF